MPHQIEGFKVPYQVQDAAGKWIYISSQKQAQDIIDEIQKRLAANPKGVAITYSANDAQANTLYHGYKDNQYNQGPHVISGGNQATVFQLVQAEIVKRGWQDKVHILPIATSVSGGYDCNVDKAGNYVSGIPSNMATKAMRERDMANIACHIGAGWDVLGLQNQKTKDKDSFAVGGGYSKAWYQDPAGQGKEAAAAMKAMAQPSFAANAENPAVVAAATDAEKKLYAAYQAGKKSGIEIPALKPAAAAAADNSAAPSAPIRYEDLPPVNPVFLTSFKKSVAESVNKLKKDATKRPVITGDSIEPEFIDRITDAIANHIQQAQAEYAQIKFTQVAAKAQDPAKPDEPPESPKHEPVGFCDEEEWNKRKAERKKQYDENVEEAKKAGKPVPPPPDDKLELIKDKYPPGTEKEEAEIYKAILYHDVKIEKLKANNEVTGYSLSKADKKILDAQMVVEDGKPRVSVTVYDRSPDAIHLTLHQTFLHAQQAGIANPRINIQDEDSPEYAMAMFKAAGEMGMTAVIRQETLDKLAEANPEQRKEYDKIIAARGAGPAAAADELAPPPKPAGPG